MKVLKIRIDKITPAHVRLTLFSGEEGYTLHNNGTLCFSPEEYDLFMDRQIKGILVADSKLLVEKEDGQS